MNFTTDAVLSGLGCVGVDLGKLGSEVGEVFTNLSQLLCVLVGVLDLALSDSQETLEISIKLLLGCLSLSMFLLDGALLFNSSLRLL